MSKGTRPCRCKFIGAKKEGIRFCPLHSAAPDMLAALKRFKELRDVPLQETTPEWHLAFKNTWDEMIAAIAKAEAQ